MKEKIYTIAINEALDKECGCPFCYLYEKLEREAVEYTLGPAMMEPDFRMITNEKGFCQKHIKKLLRMGNALSLSLVLDTHLAEVLSIFDGLSSTKEKKLFKKKNSTRDVFFTKLERVSKDCAVCSKVDYTLSRYLGTFIFMLKSEKDFLQKVLSKDCCCIEHLAALSEFSKEKLSENEYDKYFVPILKKHKEKIDLHLEQIKKFADSFDYRNAGKKCDVPKDILKRTANLLNGEFDD